MTGEPRTSLEVAVGSVRLPNPVMTAAGTSGHGAELGAYFDLASIGAVVVKSLGPEPFPATQPDRNKVWPAVSVKVWLSTPSEPTGPAAKKYVPCCA